MTCDPHRFEVFTDLHQCINCGMRLEDHQRMENYQKEISTVITTWTRELEIEKTWPDELHAADILDKYVFPAMRDWKEHEDHGELWPNEPCGRSLEQCPYDKSQHIAYFDARK